MNEKNQELIDFVKNWENDPEKMKETFVKFLNTIQAQPGVVLDFQARPGLTYSLRGAHPSQTEKPLFVMVDVIEGEPRWLSVCFYNDMVSDPQNVGDFVPGGLLGEDGLCFDVEEYSDEKIDYLVARIKEAHHKASISTDVG